VEAEPKPRATSSVASIEPQAKPGGRSSVAWVEPQAKPGTTLSRRQDPSRRWVPAFFPGFASLFPGYAVLLRRSATSALLAQRVAILPAGAILAVIFEAHGVLALRAGNARTAVGIALSILERKALQVDVGGRIRITLRRGGRRRAVRRGRRRADRSDGRASGDKRNQQHETKPGKARWREH